MGCLPSKASTRSKPSGRKYRRAKWKADKPMPESKLRAMREEFWDTQPHYGGDRVIWDALKAMVEAEKSMKDAIIEGAGIIVGADDLTVCYDERGWKYDLPKYVLSEPTNLIREKHPEDTQMVQLSTQS